MSVLAVKMLLKYISYIYKGFMSVLVEKMLLKRWKHYSFDLFR